MQALSGAPDILMMSIDDLIKLRSMLEDGEVQWDDVTKHLHNGRPLILQTYADNKLTPPKVKRGRPTKRVRDFVAEAVLTYREKFRVGYQRTTEGLARNREHPIDVSEAMVRKIFEDCNLFLYEREEKEPSHLKRFAAKFCGQLWHTDLHYWLKQPEQLYLIAFIDDRTRLIMHYEVLEDKTMDSTAEALERALNQPEFPNPYMITIDNGGEFVGEKFQAVLENNGIRQWRTRPYTPEQNGKVERWWGTLENGIVDRERIDEFVREYNEIWSHNGIHAQTGQKMSPMQFWQSEPKWTEVPEEDLGLEYYEPYSWRQARKQGNPDQ
jgi:transposase InsO family protein